MNQQTPISPCKCSEKACPFPARRDGLCSHHLTFFETPSYLLGDSLEHDDLYETDDNPIPTLSTVNHLGFPWLKEEQPSTREENALRMECLPRIRQELAANPCMSALDVWRSLLIKYHINVGLLTVRSYLKSIGLTRQGITTPRIFTEAELTARVAIIRQCKGKGLESVAEFSKKLVSKGILIDPQQLKRELAMLDKPISERAKLRDIARVKARREIIVTILSTGYKTLPELQRELALHHGMKISQGALSCDVRAVCKQNPELPPPNRGHRSKPHPNTLNTTKARGFILEYYAGHQIKPRYAAIKAASGVQSNATISSLLRSLGPQIALAPFETLPKRHIEASRAA